jgi:hypothetical protein
MSIGCDVFSVGAGPEGSAPVEKRATGVRLALREEEGALVLVGIAPVRAEGAAATRATAFKGAKRARACAWAPAAAWRVWSMVFGVWRKKRVA